MDLNENIQNSEKTETSDNTEIKENIKDQDENGGPVDGNKSKKEKTDLDAHFMPHSTYMNEGRIHFKNDKRPDYRKKIAEHAIKKTADEKTKKRREAEIKKAREMDERKMAALKRNREREKTGGVSAVVLKTVVYIAIVLFLSALSIYYVISISNDVFAFVKPHKEYTFTVEKDMTTKDIARELDRQGIIEYDWAFRMYVKYKEDDAGYSYIIGDHELDSSMNYDQILTELTVIRYKAVEIWTTIPEGYTTDQIIDLLVSKEICTREDLISVINEYDFKHEFVQLLKENGYPVTRKYRLEGYLYPDTYAFYKNSDAVSVINKMLNNFDEKFWSAFDSTYKEACDKYGMTFDEAVTLASMVQAEGKTLSDYENISQVFHNRLSSKDFLKLESDTTVQYCLPERAQILDSSIMNSSWVTSSPYNTYEIEGLPPGAVCNPGLDALESTLYPDMDQNFLEENGFKKENVYYFCSDLTGQIYYAQTLAQHNKNVQKVREINEKVLSGEYVHE